MNVRVAVLSAVLAGCAPATTTTVVIDADSRVRSETRALVLTVRSGRELAPRFYVELREDDLHWPATLVLAPDHEGDEDDRWWVSADAIGGGASPLVSATLAGDHVGGTAARTRLTLEAACIGVQCNLGLDQTCVAGGCTSIESEAP